MDEYLASFPEEVRTILEKVRQTIRQAAPEAEETISYGMPTLTLNGRQLVYFAAWKRHLSLYPVPAGDEAFEQELAPYRAARGTVRFPYGRPVPYGLIERMVRLLVQQRADSGG